ncbi:MAG: hypothetical protein ACYDCC_00780 [Actinomycetota bacterium]
MKMRRALYAGLVVAALGSSIGSATAAPRLYCGFNLDTVCRIICPKCASAPVIAPKTSSAK